MVIAVAPSTTDISRIVVCAQTACCTLARGSHDVHVDDTAGMLRARGFQLQRQMALEDSASMRRGHGRSGSIDSPSLRARCGESETGTWREVDLKLSVPCRMGRRPNALAYGSAGSTYLGRPLQTSPSLLPSRAQVQAPIPDILYAYSDFDT